jgi:hypothetical protein
MSNPEKYLEKAIVLFGGLRLACNDPQQKNKPLASRRTFSEKEVLLVEFSRFCPTRLWVKHQERG